MEATYARLQAAVDAWQLRDVKPIPSGEVALVCSAMFDGEAVILKVSPDVDDESLVVEARALRAWQSSGVVPRVLASRDGDLSMLLEKLEPAIPLLEAEPDALRRIAILGELARRLHQASAEVDGIANLGESAFVARRLHDLQGHRDAKVLRSLANDTSGRALLHMDLHGHNALNDRGSWKLIDPKPCVGDPHADVFVLIREDYPRDETVHELAELRIDCFASSAGLDVDRTRDWVRVCARAEVGFLRSLPSPTSGRAEFLESLQRLVYALDNSK